jgi:septum formation protein
MRIMLNIVLSSISPNRKLLLQRLGLGPFVTVAPGVDETPLLNETAPDLVKRLALAKARAVTSDFPNSLIIGADQVGVLNDKILGKPGNHDDAVAQLSQASGKRIQFFTGLCLFNSQTHKSQICVETYCVTLRKLTPQMIENYLQREKPYQCAGSFQAEGLGIALFERLVGDDFNTLLGLPLIRLIQMFENEGLKVI